MVQDTNNTFELIERLNDFSTLEGVVGLFGEKGDSKVEGADLTIAQLAAVHEFGADGHIPTRPWVSVGFERAMPDMEEVIAKGVDQVIAGSTSAGEVLDRATLIAETEIKEYGVSGVPPPNAPSTIARKGSSVTLVDTGRMVGSVTHGYRPRTNSDG